MKKENKNDLKENLKRNKKEIIISKEIPIVFKTIKPKNNLEENPEDKNNLEEAIEAKEDKKNFEENRESPEEQNVVSTYKIKKGDTLYKISQRTGIDLEDLKTFNSIKDINRISI